MIKELGYPVCHQLVERSFYPLMPLCARCSGIYLGFLSTVIFLLSDNKRRKGIRLPSIKYLIILISFIFFLGIDVFAENWGLYQTNNHLRLITGLLMGITLAAFILPVFNFTFWSSNDKISLLDGIIFIKLLLISAFIYFITAYLSDWLYYLISIASLLGLFALYLFINSLIYLIVLKKENQGRNYKDFAKLGFIAGIISIGEMLILAFIKFKGV